MAKKKSAPKKKRASVKVKPRKHKKKADDIFSPHGYKRSRKK